MMAAPTHFETVTPAAWLDLVGDPRSTLTISHYGYTNHPLDAVPINERTLDVHLLWFVVDSSFGGTIAGAPVDLVPGTFLWIRPGVVHSFVIPRGLRTYRLRIDLRRRERPVSLAEPWLVARNAWELRAPLEELLQEHEVESDHRAQRLRQLAGTISLLAFRRTEAARPVATLTAAQRFKIQTLVLDRIRDGISPNELARALHLSPVYFSRVFRQTYGLPPRAWLVRERLRMASTLLIETDHRVSEIARACGFRDPNLFSRQFRRVYRHSPRQHRRS